MGVIRLTRDRRQDVAAPDVAAPADPLAALLQRAGRGDQAAFAALYDELAPMVVGIVRRVLRDPAQSDEVAQEAFVDLWRLAPRYDATKGTVTAWAATVAHRRAVDRVRSEQSARDRVAREATKIVREHDHTSDEVVEALDGDLDQRRVRRALDSLSPLQREAVELAYFGGHTYREVAVLLAVPEGTVKTRIRDGLIRLRDELGGER
jgi:RNA polymerase sigma-70 factor (ECF subfamily)